MSALRSEQGHTKGRTSVRGNGALLIALALACSSVSTSLNGCSSRPTFFRDGSFESVQGATIAVLPLVNFSRAENAPGVVMDALVVELLETKAFVVVDPGVVEKAVMERRIRVTDRLPLETLREMGESLGVDYLLVGSIGEFDFVEEDGGRIPTVSLSLRIVTSNDGRIVWAATHSRRGDDAETVFGLGKVESLEKLASVAVEEIARSLPMERR